MDINTAYKNAERRYADIEVTSVARQMILTSEVMKEVNGDNGFRYANFYEAVMDLGTETYVDDLTLPDDVPDGPPKQCYVNAAMLALVNPEKYTYVEGYACSDDLGIVMSHAWVVDYEGRIIDNTWGSLASPPSGVSYYGIKFSTEYLEMRWSRTKNYFAGVLGEDYGYYEHVKHGMITDEDGVVIGEVDDN